LLYFTFTLGFDIDGFEDYFGKNTGQQVDGWGRENIQRAFGAHLHSFLLNGITAIVQGDVKFDICSHGGINIQHMLYPIVV
jgi:hypothetical protein